MLEVCSGQTDRLTIQPVMEEITCQPLAGIRIRDDARLLPRLRLRREDLAQDVIGVIGCPDFESCE